MIEERWTYSNSDGLTKWYGNVDYYSQYIIGQWFALEVETGKELCSNSHYGNFTQIIALKSQ